MADIMDAYEVCSLIPNPHERHQCYTVFGLDANQMANYYDTVVRLEKQLSTELDNPSTVSGRWPHLWQQQHPQQPFVHPFHKTSAITGSAPPPPAAAAALAVAMLYIAVKHLAFV
jgi:hypothetical protein